MHTTEPMTHEEQIQYKLDALADYKAQVDALNLQKQDAINAVLTPEIRAEVADIEAEFAGKAEGAQENINALTADIKFMVIEHGGTVKGEFLMAVRNKGRTTWDSKKLAGYAAAHPEIEQFKKVGNPTVTIRAKK